VEQVREVLEGHGGRRLPTTATRLLAVAVVLLAAVGGAAHVLAGRHAERPARCGVSGHRDWCRTPSALITEPGLARVVRAYCPGLAGTPLHDLQPQPLRLAHLAGGSTRSVSSGRPGTEDALLGTSSTYAFVTRWDGGRDAGQVDVRCPGQDHVVPELLLTRAQYASTVAALGDVTHRSIDFTALAVAAAPEVSPDRRLPLGTFSCDTSRVDLRRLAPERRFSCEIDIHRLIGTGSYPLRYVTTRSRPYTRPATT
jgi:hypothetical protein